MRCLRLDCGKELPEDSRKGTKFCCAACRAKYNREQEAKNVAEDTETPESASNPLPVPDPHSNTATPSLTEGADAKARTRKRPPNPYKARRPPRMPLDAQILSQAPPEAVVYQLVLPLRLEEETPRIAPPQGQGTPPNRWRLDPFEPPDDIRLLDGHVYRILFFDGEGVPVRPGTKGYLPALHFFLGPPDLREHFHESEYVSILRLIDHPERRDRYERRIARMRLDALQKIQADAEKQRMAEEAQIEELRNQAKQAQRERQRSIDRAERQRRAEEQRVQQEKQERALERKKAEAKDRWIRGGMTVLLGISPLLATGIFGLINKLSNNEEVDSTDYRDFLKTVTEEVSKHLPKILGGNLPQSTSGVHSASETPKSITPSATESLPARTQTTSESTISEADADNDDDGITTTLDEAEQTELIRLLKDKRLGTALFCERQILEVPELADTINQHEALQQVSAEERKHLQEIVRNPEKMRFLEAILAHLFPKS